MRQAGELPRREPCGDAVAVDVLDVFERVVSAEAHDLAVGLGQLKSAADLAQHPGIARLAEVGSRRAAVRLESPQGIGRLVDDDGAVGLLFQGDLPGGSPATPEWPRLVAAEDVGT